MGRYFPVSNIVNGAEYAHDAATSAGVLLVNLGTPDAPTPSAVRRYLAEFLSDPRVIETPGIIWWPLLHGIILRTRPRRAAKNYQKVWTANGSPLLDISKKQAAAVQQELSARVAGPVHVELAMRYGNPSVADALQRLTSLNARRILVFPLYPQYSATTTASTFDAVLKTMATWRWWPELRLINHYHDEPGYIEILTESIRCHFAAQGKPEKIMFSFHGLPKHYFLAGDPYFCECQKTARLVAEQLELAEEDWCVSFQSRFGPREWLKPYTDKTLRQWGESGIKSVAVICPGFAADCLETLEEIRMQNRNIFLEAGGKHFHYIPALNDQPMHIAMLTDLVIKHCTGWPEFAGQRDTETLHAELQETAQRAARLRQLLF
jgi:ferrochelatase